MTLGVRMADVASPGILSATVVRIVPTARMNLNVRPSRQIQDRQKSSSVYEDRSCVTKVDNVCHIDTCVTVRWIVRMDQMSRDVVSFPKNSGRLTVLFD